MSYITGISDDITPCEIKLASFITSFVHIKFGVYLYEYGPKVVSWASYKRVRSHWQKWQYAIPQQYVCWIQFPVNINRMYIQKNSLLLKKITIFRQLEIATDNILHCFRYLSSNWFIHNHFWKACHPMPKWLRGEWSCDWN